MRSQSQLYNPYNPLAPAQPGAAFLPLFNQTASQRRVSVDYSAEFSGPSHAGRWTVYCVGEFEVVSFALDCVFLIFDFSEWDPERDGDGK